MRKRQGNKKPKKRVKRKKANLLIYTDGKKTEVNYLNSLKKTKTGETNRSVIIRTAKTKELLDSIQREALEYPNNPEKWIVLDRDQVKNFDELIQNANNNDINVAWSNPCIEVWFGYYYGEKIISSESKKAIRDFNKLFEKRTNQSYQKNDTNIHKKLIESGNEERAIKMASDYLKISQQNNSNPSDQVGCTTMHILVKQLK